MMPRIFLYSKSVFSIATIEINQIATTKTLRKNKSKTYTKETNDGVSFLRRYLNTPRYFLWLTIHQKNVENIHQMFDAVILSHSKLFESLYQAQFFLIYQQFYKNTEAKNASRKINNNNPKNIGLHHVFSISILRTN